MTAHDIIEILRAKFGCASFVVFVNNALDALEDIETRAALGIKEEDYAAVLEAHAELVQSIRDRFRK